MSIQLSNDTSFEELLQNNNKVVVKYFADWCGSCKLFTPKFRRFSEDERFANIAFVDVNAEENPNARRAAGVDNLPFFAVFENGKLVKGYSTSLEEKVLELLEMIK